MNTLKSSSAARSVGNPEMLKTSSATATPQGAWASRPHRSIPVGGTPTLLERLRLAALLVALLAFASTGWTQESITTAGSAVTQNFDTLGNATTATLPTGWKTGADWSTGNTTTGAAAGTSGTGALTGSSSGNFYNFANGVTATSTDRAIGFLTTGSYTSPRSIIYAFTNNTGGSVNSLTISWNFEKYRTGTRAFDWTFFHGSTSNATTAATDGNQSYTADLANAVVNPPTSTAKTVTLSGLSIANGSTYYLRWTYTGVGGSTNAQGLGIDDFSITLTAASSTAPTITNISPSSGPVGTSVTITGTNFASNATVSFTGNASSNVTFTNNTSLSAIVPSGATTGPITVTVGEESATSATAFTVINPLAPVLTTTGNFTAFTTTAGNASASQSISVNGTNLSASINATAPTGFEVSSDNSTYGPSATIAQSGGTLFARIASTATAGALTGNITLASTNATSLSIPVSGTVTEISTTSLATWVGTGNLNNSNSTVTANATAANITTATVTRTGLVFSSNTNRYNSSSWNSLSNFLTITVTPATGYTLDLNGANFTAAMGSSSTGPANYQVFSSADNYAAPIGTLASSNSTYPSTTLQLSGSNFTGLSSIIFRIVGNQTAWNGSATASSGTGGPNSIIITGTVNPDSGATAPAITSATTASATVGAPFTYTITASNTPTSFGATGLPDGLSVNSTTGDITGTPTTAGTTNATITATNSGGTGNATLAFTIAQGTPIITTPPTASAINAGQTLADSNLTGGNASVPGAFAFATPSFVPSATGSQLVTFTPTDAANYTTANTSVTVTVNPGQDSTFDTWTGGNVTMTPAILQTYAIGGGNYNGTVAPQASVTTVSGGNLTLTAIVRTDDPALSVIGEHKTDLTLGTWISLGTGNATVDQSGVPTGNERRAFTTPADGTKKFLRLRAIYTPPN